MTDERTATPGELSRIPQLDGVRGIAALMVMVFHFIGHHGEPPFVRQAAVLGQTGVDLFFVLSGFLITRILIAEREADNYFPTFYARRVLRIFPLYYLSLVIYLWVVPAVFGRDAPWSEGSAFWVWAYLKNVPITFTVLQPSAGPGLFWSLAVEEHFYLAWPLLVYASSRRTFLYVILVTIGGAAVLRYFFIEAGIKAFYFTLTRMDALAFGALLVYATFLPAAAQAALGRAFRVAVPLVAMALVALSLAYSGDRNPWIQVVKLSLFPAFYSAVLGWLMFDSRALPAVRFLSGRGLVAMGAIAYGLYVFHPLCYWLVGKLVDPASFWLDAFLCFGLTALTAALSYRYFERPILRLNRFFNYRRGYRTGNSVATASN